MASPSKQKISTRVRLDNTDEIISIKHRGKIYTPDYLVNVILDFGNYTIGNINQKHVIDNSCGDGQFMVHVVNRYCRDFLSKSNDINILKNELETYIHAIELDSHELENCAMRCDEVARSFGINKIKWDFYNTNALECDIFNDKMDFVVGNPPYVRTHNLKANKSLLGKYLFNNSGMTDLYITFYEIGLHMLNSTGRLTYISPSSFFTSLAGRTMRDYLYRNNLITKLCDLKHFQPFAATTYTTIVALNKKNINKKQLSYYLFNKKEQAPFFIDDLHYDDFYINGNFYFSNKKNLVEFKKILTNNTKTDICIKNGYATLADGVFINDFDQISSNFIIPVIKASSGKWTKIFYPYDENGNFIPEDLISRDKQLYNYLQLNKDKLLKRSNENKNSRVFWYAFGRSQGIKDTQKNKLAIGTLIKKPGDIKTTCAPSGCGVYSGLYATSETFNKNQIADALKSSDFFKYAAILGKYKSGGYYTFSSKDIKIFLDYYFSKESRDTHE
jgi:hypothetical protein